MRKRRMRRMMMRMRMKMRRSRMRKRRMGRMRMRMRGMAQDLEQRGSQMEKALNLKGQIKNTYRVFSKNCVFSSKCCGFS